MRLSDGCTLAQAASRLGMPRKARHDLTTYDAAGTLRASGYQVSGARKLHHLVMGEAGSTVSIWDAAGTNDAGRNRVVVEAAAGGAAAYIPIMLVYKYEQERGKA